MNYIGTLSTSYSPPFKIVSKYFISAIVSFITFNFLLLINYNNMTGHHFQPIILSITHIATLGWITMVIFGAMFQLVPVVLEVKLFSELLAEVQFWLYLVGVILITYKFYNIDSNLSFILPAILLNLAMYIFTFNIVASLTSIKNWNLIASFFVSALFWLVITAIAGLLLARNLDHPYIKIDHLQYLKLHANVAFIGWVTMVIMGVSLKLIPMFTLSHNFTTQFSKGALILINIGLLGINYIFHYKDISYWYYVFTPIIVVGLLLYLIQVYVIFKNRIRKKLDIGLKYTRVAYIFLGISILIGSFSSFFYYENIKNFTLVYGFSVLLGFFSTLIVGQMYKIVPFLVWYHKYSDKVGFQSVPMLKDLFNEKLACYQMYVMIAGIVFSIVFWLIDNRYGLLLSFFLLFISSIMFLINMIKIFRN